MDVKYNGRLVDSDNFRVVMHHISGISRVAEGWGDYQSLLATNEWFEKPPKLKPKKRKHSKKAVNDVNSS